MEGKERLHVMTRETTNWLKNLQEFIEREELKTLMKEDRVAEIVVKMMEQRVMKKLLKEDREIFDIVVRVVKKKCNENSGNGEVVAAEEDGDYKKVAKIARDVMKDIAEEFKKFIKTDGAAITAVELLDNVDLEKLKKDDKAMAKILSNAEAVNRKEIEHNDHDEEELLLKHDNNVQPAGKNIIKEKLRTMRKHLGSLMSFLDDEKFRKGLGDGARMGLEVMDALSKSAGSEQIEDEAKQHRYCGWLVLRLEDYSHRHDFSQSAEIIAKAIKSINDECPPRPWTRLKRADELKNISNEFMEGLESREELIEKILIVLKNDQVNAVGVFGMGGCGKTTLVKEVASKRTSDLFDKRLVIEISEAPDIKGIQDQIAEGINLPLDDVHSVAQRARKIYNGLLLEKKRKILIILDNMWNKLNLDEVGIPRESTKDFCCKLLITTREREVCNVMDVENANIFEMGMLNEKEATNLFENQSGKKVDSGEYKPIVDRLLRKCGGLPLAIVATASALRGKDLSAWYRFAEESEKPISGQVSSEYRKTYSILETSYKLIETEEKRMFFFLACLSPLDTAISVDDLMRHGIGLDLFQHLNNLSEARERALGWVNELISSSLLIKDEIYGQVKIHDVVRASAISFAEKGKGRLTLVESIPRWICKETFEKFRAISLLSGRDFSRLTGVKAPMLEVLLLKGDVFSTVLSSNFFGGMTNLKVLSLSDIDFKLGLPKSIEKLKRLKTLHLHHCHLKDIKMVGKLMSLLVLSLRGSTLEELATEIGELCNLRLLDMGGCKGITSIPANVLSRLSCLEGIYMFDSFDDWADDGAADNKASISELNKLSHLNVLEMEVPRSAQLLSRLVDQLGKFRIHLDGLGNWDMDEVQGFRYVLWLDDIYGNCDEFERALLKKTDCLRISHGQIENIVPHLDEEGFKDLKYLQVESYDGMDFIISSEKQKKSTAFVSLENLKLSDVWDLTWICQGKAPAGIFSNLKFLTLYKLPKLKYGLPLTCVPLNLVEVSVQECKYLKSIAYEDVYESLEEEALVKKKPDMIWLPYLKSVEIGNKLEFEEDECSSLSSIMDLADNRDDSFFKADKSFFNLKNIFPSLESLRTSVRWPNVTLWSQECHVSNFQNLKVLDIYNSITLGSLGSQSLFAALVRLEELTISRCCELEEVITEEREGQEPRESVIEFPLLKHLKMDYLNKVKRFYGGSYKLVFPILKSLIISWTPEMTNFDGLENLTAFFSDKIVFPRLEELHVYNVSDKVVRLWRPSLDAQAESGSPNLQKLTLGNTTIPPYVSLNLSHLEFVDFSESRILFSNSAIDREAIWTYSQVPRLENLSVDGSDSLEILFGMEDDAATKRFCGQMTGIKLSNVPKLKLIPLNLFKDIRSLSLNGLRWKYVFSSDLFIKDREQLQLLENLEIDSCPYMEVIIKDELGDDGADRVYVFPRLKSLTLTWSYIKYFANGNSSALHFPSLERLKVAFCYIRSFWSGPFVAPKLKQVELRSCGKMPYFLSGNMNEVQELPSLESVSVDCCDKLLSFSSVPLSAPKLHDVDLSYCSSLEWFSPSDPNNVLDLPSLEKVSLFSCRSMRSLSTGGIKAPKLSELNVDFEDYSKRSNDELQMLLTSLREEEEEGTEKEEDDDDEAMSSKSD